MSWTLQSQRWCQYFQIYSIPLHIPLPSFTYLSDKETAAKESQPNDSNKQTNSQYQRKNLSFVSNSLNQTSFQTQRFILIIYNCNKSMRKRVRSRGQRKGKTITTNLFSLMREEKIKGLMRTVWMPSSLTSTVQPRQSGTNRVTTASAHD